MRVLFEHGAFDQDDTTMVSAVIVWYAIAVLADALCQPLWRVIYAQRRVWTVLAVNGLQTGVRLFSNSQYNEIGTTLGEDIDEWDLLKQSGRISQSSPDG